MADPSILDIKRGDTLSLAAYLPEGALPPGDWSASCALIEKAGTTRYEIEATLTPPAGDETRYFLRLYASTAVTSQWKKGKLIGDVQFDDASTSPPFRVSSEDFTVNVLDDRT